MTVEEQRHLRFKQMGLTRAEMGVVTYLISGSLSNKQISELLFVTVKTVKFHLTSVYKKAKVRKRTELMCLINDGLYQSDVEFLPVVAGPSPERIKEIEIELSVIKSTIEKLTKRVENLEMWLQ